MDGRCLITRLASPAQSAIARAGGAIGSEADFNVLFDALMLRSPTSAAARGSLPRPPRRVPGKAAIAGLVDRRSQDRTIVYSG